MEDINDDVQEVELVPILKPSLSASTNMHRDLIHPRYTIASNNNEYILAELDRDGKEVIGSDFTVNETTFRTSFACNPNFTVKKNPS